MRPAHEHKRRLILPFFIAFIMISSAFGVLIGGFTNTNPEYYEYNNILFKQVNAQWAYTTNDRTYAITYGPQEVEDFATQLPKNLPELFQQAQKIYLTTPPEATNQASTQEFLSNLKPHYSLFTACSTTAQDHPACANLPLKDCNTPQEGTYTLLITPSTTNSLTFTDSCLTLEGTPTYIHGILDTIILRLTGVL